MQKWGENNIFKLTTRNGSLHQESNDNGARMANFTTIKKSSCYEQDVPAPRHS